MNRLTKTILSKHFIISLSFILNCSILLSQNQNYITVLDHEISHGDTIAVFIYNEHSQIIEYNSIGFFYKFIYNSNDLLMKVETGADFNPFSSLEKMKKMKLITPRNFTTTNYDKLKYDENGILIEIEHYYSDALKSKHTFEYLENKIVKKNLHNPEGKITTYDMYEYDAIGNMVNKKYYSRLDTTSTEPHLINETCYHFDDKINPLKNLKILGIIGFYSNPNNIIESTFIRHDELANGYTETKKYKYEYNDEGYPLKCIEINQGNRLTEYKYIKRPVTLEK